MAEMPPKGMNVTPNIDWGSGVGYPGDYDFNDAPDPFPLIPSAGWLSSLPKQKQQYKSSKEIVFDELADALKSLSPDAEELRKAEGIIVSFEFGIKGIVVTMMREEERKPHRASIYWDVLKQSPVKDLLWTAITKLLDVIRIEEETNEPG